MKKLYLLFLLTGANLESSMISVASRAAMGAPSTPTTTLGAAQAALKAASTHYVINLTGRTIILNFYQKSILTGKTVWYDAKTFGPLILAGKATTNIYDTLNYQLLPTPIDMHTNTCFNITVDAFKFNSTKLKDKSIKGTYMPTPATSATPNDIQVTLDKDQLIITELDTCMGIKIPGATKKQWPSVQDLAISRMTPEQKIITLQQNNTSIRNDITKLTKEIKKTSNPVKKNNRKKMITNKKALIKKNEQTIAKLQAEVTAAAAKNQVVISPQAQIIATATPALITTAVPSNSADIKLVTENTDLKSDDAQETDFKIAPNLDDYVGAQDDTDLADNNTDDNITT